MHDWEALFEERILSRGWDYWLEGRVEDLVKDGETFRARVWGSEAYDVEIVCSGGKVKALFCSCPYEDNCKHSAAVLYALEECGYEPGGGGEIVPWRELVEQADPAVLRELLIELAEADEGLRKKLILRLRPEVTPQMLAAMKQEVDRLIRQLDDEIGYIDDEDYNDFCLELGNYLEEQEKALCRQDVSAGFALLCHAVTALEAVEEAFDYYRDDLLELCGAWLERLVSAADDEARAAMCHHLLHDLEQSGELADWAYVMLLDCFNEPEELRLILDMLDEQVSRCQGLGDAALLAGAVVDRAFVMEKLWEEPPAVEAYLRAFADLPDVQLRLAEILMEQERYAEAIPFWDKLLDGSRLSRFDRMNEELRLECYQHLNDPLLYRGKLLDYLLKWRQKDLAWYRRLKALYEPEEWAEVRLEVMAHQKREPDIYLELLAEEGLSQLLLEEIKSYNSLRSLDRYAPLLVKDYQAEVLALYQTMLEKKAARASNRSHYAALAGDLRRLRQIEGGDTLALALRDQWRVQYKKRRAMQDELNHI